MSSFADWFEEISGAPPYPYQAVLATGAHLPDLLAAPTGSGKTAAAVLGWLWRRRHADPAVQEATPRRLVFCLPMRTLVDQTATVARGWLAKAAPDVQVHALLGGAVDQSWDDGPDQDAVLVGTQDQLLSRALNRGYAMSRFRWPVHFAWLNNDALWVMDEVQLMGVGASTAAQLQAFRERLGTARPTRTLWMSATLEPGRLATVDHAGMALTRLGLEKADEKDERLAVRLAAPKRLDRAATAVAAKLAHVPALAAEIRAAHVEGTRTLVVVNRVDRAQELARLLRRPGDVPVELVHSRFRPVDRAARQGPALEATWSGILVATQAIEAGVDLSARTLFTELAPWSSLVQRFGRCNRAGEHPEARVWWIDVPEEESAPYTAEPLVRARGILAGLSDVGPQSLAKVPQEAAEPVPPVVRLRDLLDLFDTEPDLAGHDLDVSRFVRATEDRDVQVLWRDWTGESPPSDLPDPRREELCSAPIGGLTKLLKQSTAWRWDSVTGAWTPNPRPVPGTTVLLPRSAGGYSDLLGWTGNPSDRPTIVGAVGAPPDSDESDRLSVGCAEYVTLRLHSTDVAEEMDLLRARLAGDQPWDLLVQAGRAHDLGKAHPAFQEMLESTLAPDDPRRGAGPWAKSDGRRTRHVRRHFRHELASALALLQQGAPDLVCYLAMAHHGKVRTAIRARPDEWGPDGVGRWALGVHEGDLLPATDLGGILVPEQRLSLEPMEMGDSAEGSPSWAARTLGLLDEHGPFRLAWWESLVRVADWRGTRRRAQEVSGD